MLAVTMMLPAARLVRKESTNLWVDKEAASRVFLANLTIKRIKQSASLVAKTSTPTSQRKHHAIVVTLVKSLIQAVPDAPSVTVEKLVLDKTARASHAKRDSTEALPWTQHLAPFVRMATPLLPGVRNVSRTHEVGLPANAT